jgi:hypothetical protein
MSFWLSIRAGRVSGKAAKIYRDVMGYPPNKYTAEFLQEVAYHGSDEFNLAFSALTQELGASRITHTGSTEYKHTDIESPSTNRIVQYLIRMNNTQSIKDWVLKDFEVTITRLKRKEPNDVDCEW